MSEAVEPASTVVDLSAEPGVIGRAAQLVEAAEDDQPLVERLLGNTWLVERLSQAMFFGDGTLMIPGVMRISAKNRDPDDAYGRGCGQAPR